MPNGSSQRLQNIPEGCICRNKTYLFCKNKGLTRVPDGIAGNVTRLILANNTIKDLYENTFVQYQQLQLMLLMNNRLKGLDKHLFSDTKQLAILFLQNNLLTDSDLMAFKEASNLEYLDLSDNRIRMNMKFPTLMHLRELLLENNLMEKISAETFSNLPKLQFLSVRQNKISYIHGNAFHRLGDLRELDLSHNLLSTLSEESFSVSRHLSKLFIGHNPFHYVPSKLFVGLKNLSSLNLEEIEISNIDVSMFSMMKKLKFIYLKNFYYCTFAPMVPNCEPKTDGVSTSENLLGRPILRVTVWIVAFITCAGNIYVFWERVTTKDENRVLSWIVRNLAVSDFAMGIYLVVIGIKDIEYRGIYHRVSHEWISSWTCTLIGSIAMLSSEVSIIILVFMSLERFLLIAVPFGGHQTLNWRTSCFSVGVIWTFGLSIAFIPVIHWRNSTRFYGANGMCFPLHMDDPYFAGWQFSAFVFIGINLLGILTIAFLYTGMFWSIWRTRHATTLNVGDFEFAIRFFFIVLTNTVCWAPVIVLKVLAFLRIYISETTEFRILHR
ncbi:hypothetical protein RUM43_010553 [Polyplax serrata]|uniref:G-protein coupled receptors family 1 profile domain-containing protein n=1 Tax=Polyplax serrata TaxID=468196 RepID=A0AAN8P489_POLSC